MNTPWGESDSEEKFGDGIMFYGTPSHGGFKLDVYMEAILDRKLREHGLSAKEARMGYGPGWYEEDCAASAVMFGWPERFNYVLTSQGHNPTAPITTDEQFALDCLTRLRGWLDLPLFRKPITQAMTEGR